MRARNTVLFTIVFLALASYIYLFELQPGLEKRPRPLLDLKSDQIAEITLSYPDKEIRLRKEASGNWVITHPTAAPADPSTMSGVLNALATSEIRKSIEKRPGPEDLRAFGLDQSAIRVAVTLESSEALAPILVGAQTPVGNTVYVMREGLPEVLLTGAALKASLEKKLYDFRDKRVLEVETESVRGLALESPKGHLLLTRRKRDWWIEKPRLLPTDPPSVQAMLAALRRVTARDFVEESVGDFKAYGLAEPRLKITLLVGEQGRRKTLAFGDQRNGKDEVYAITDSAGPIYTVYKGVFDALDKDLTALRDRQVFRFAIDRVEKIRLQSQRESVLLVRQPDGEWGVEAPRKGGAQADQVTGYLKTLSQLKATGFAAMTPKKLKSYGFSPPELTVTLEGKDGKAIGTLELGARVGEGYYAKREADQQLYIIDAAAYRAILKRPGDFVAESRRSGT